MVYWKMSGMLACTVSDTSIYYEENGPSGRTNMSAKVIGGSGTDKTLPQEGFAEKLILPLEALMENVLDLEVVDVEDEDYVVKKILINGMHSYNAQAQVGGNADKGIALIPEWSDSKSVLLAPTKEASIGTALRLAGDVKIGPKEFNHSEYQGVDDSRFVYMCAGTARDYCDMINTCPIRSGMEGRQMTIICDKSWKSFKVSLIDAMCAATVK